MNLRLNLVDDFVEDDNSEKSLSSRDISFLEKLPNELQDIVSSIKRKTFGSCPKLKSSGSGAFGTIEIDNNKVKKVLDLMPSKTRKTLLRDHKIQKNKSQLYFLVNRLDNYCKDIKKFVSISRNYFPNNFVSIYNCNICQSNTEDMSNVYVEMGVGRGITLKKFINENHLKKPKAVLDVIVQVFYIFLTFNSKKIYHNDVKPANIMVGIAETDIKYRHLLDKKTKSMIKLDVKMGSYYPIIIDYDLSSIGEPVYVESSDFVAPGSPDVSFFINYVVNMSSVNKQIIQILDEFPIFFEVPEITQKLSLIFKHMRRMTTHDISYK